MQTKTICEQLGIKVKPQEPFEILNKEGLQLYYENSTGYWEKKTFNEDEQLTYWSRSSGWWEVREYDDKGSMIYNETSGGVIYDVKIRELTMDEIAEKFDISVEQLKIKKG